MGIRRHPGRGIGGHQGWAVGGTEGSALRFFCGRGWGSAGAFGDVLMNRLADGPVLRNATALAACLSAGLLVWCAPTSADEPPSLQAEQLTQSPVLDGDVLNDSAWRGFTPATGFVQTQPNEGQPATQRTEAFVGFTKEALYIGVVCHDEAPEQIIVADSRRDSSLRDTDSFQVMLDTFRDRQNGFIFGTNPAGIEYDAQITREGEAARSGFGAGLNLNWDTSWSVATRKGEYGWSAEFRIPFKSLRYGSGAVQSWGINFQRNIRRNKEEAFWSPLPRQHSLQRVSQAGALDGLHAPPQRSLLVIPYGLAQGAKGGPFIRGTEGDTEFGVDLKYSLTPSLTLDATYNTDFAQVEADDIQVNLDRFSLFFAEKRPFFLENADQFSIGNSEETELFFSRRIGIGADGARIPIEGGVRLSGKLGGSTNIGLLHMRSDAVDGAAPRNDYSVARVSQELANRSSVGAMFVNRQGDGSHLRRKGQDHNRAYAIDGRWGIGRNSLLSAWVAKTDSPHLKGREHAFNLRGEYSSEKWSNTFSYTEVADNFNPEVGFLARRAYRKATGILFRRIRPENFWGLHELRPHIFMSNHWGYGDGRHESMYLHIDNHWEWRSGLEVHTGVNFTHEAVRVPFELVEGVVVPPGDYDHKETQLVFLTDEAKPLSFRLEARIGGRFGGDRINLDPTLRYRIGEKFTSELTWGYNDFDLPAGDFEVIVGRLRATYSFTPRISLQALVQYDNRSDVIATNLRFAWLQTANAGLFLVYNELDDRDFSGNPRRELILKYSRIVNLL